LRRSAGVGEGKSIEVGGEEKGGGHSAYFLGQNPHAEGKEGAVGGSKSESQGKFNKAKR